MNHEYDRQLVADYGEGFYSLRAWKRLRYEALRLYGRECAACKTKAGPLHIDHIKPRSKHPELQFEITNLQVLCESCNLGKGSWDGTDWRCEESKKQALLKKILEDNEKAREEKRRKSREEFHTKTKGMSGLEKINFIFNQHEKSK